MKQEESHFQTDIIRIKAMDLLPVKLAPDE